MDCWQTRANRQVYDSLHGSCGNVCPIYAGQTYQAWYQSLLYALRGFCFLLLFEVYVGKDDELKDNSALVVCDRLVDEAGLTANRDRILYIDNYYTYTSVKLVKHMLPQYGWTGVGTIVPTNKKSIEDDDIPFLKLSSGARNEVKHGWYREAVLKVKTKHGKHYYIQYTTWCDKKQVCFLNAQILGYTCNPRFHV